MKKLVINDCNGENPVTILITPKAEEMLYELLGDFDRETRITHDLFHVMTTMQTLAAIAFEAIQEPGAQPVNIPDLSGESNWTLLKVFDFFNYLEFQD